MNSDYGAYGVLRFLKKNDDSIVANYPIDDETLTFGKGADCNIRLYYPAVSQQHAKIIFKENKGFLLIYGGHGVHVDGCTVFPSTSSGETAVPLTNNTILEISKKRFRFEYPPKPYRAALAAQINTPTQNPSKRRTRFSLIQSTEVFSPRPDPDPKVNLRILQSPLRRSPLKKAAHFEEEEEEPIVLVESNHPRVMEDDQDLVIIEDVPKQEPVAPTPARVTVPMIPRQQQQFTTPRRKPPRNSLHRAVLIRSAQKAALREIAREEEEEQEVDAVEMIIEEGPAEQEDDVQPHVVDEEDEEEDMDVDDEEAGDEAGDERGRSTGLSSWRRGVEAVRNGLRALSRSLSPEKDPEPEDEKNPLADDDEVQTSAPLVSDLVSASQRAASERPSDDIGSPFRSPAKPSRESLSLADRVRGSGRVSLAGPSRSPLKPSQPLAWRGERGEQRVFAQTSPRRVSAEERQAIQERRRQSLATPDPFWAKNGIPGSRSPAKAGIFPSASEPARIAAPNFGVPLSPQRAPATPPPAAPPGLTSFDEFMSPSRAWGASRDNQEPVEEAVEEEEPDEMLQRLKNTIGDMKRRRSMRSEEDEARLRALAEKEQSKADEPEEEAEEDGATVEDVSEPEDETAGPSTAREATPEIELRHVFHPPTATPRLSGVRDLHKRAEAEARVRNAGTPALDGMQQMFSRPSLSRREHEDIIPSSDDEEARAAAAEEQDSEEEEEPEPAPAPVKAPARNARLKKSETMPTVTRTIAKTAPVRKTASTSRIDVRPGSGRSTPNDEVQDEPAPTRSRTRTATGPKAAAAGKASGSQQTARSTVRVTKPVDRAPRSRKATETGDDAAPAPTKAAGKKPATRTAKASAPTRSTTAASTRSKKSPSDSTPDPLEDDSDEDDAAPVASRVRQRHATGESQQPDDEDKPRATRRTPARTAAARKPATAAAPARKTTARKAAPEKENTPDRVKEEDEEDPTPPPPPPPARTTTRRTAVRKADAGGQSEPEQAQAKARPARTRAATRG
ncbi:unnamed protein product [Peniophora sp. CBMAI 1063]|nr:unnamed protein product [Peniophora sp. CBMAI 1063]